MLGAQAARLPMRINEIQCAGEPPALQSNSCYSQIHRRARQLFSVNAQVHGTKAEGTGLSPIAPNV